MASWCHFPTGFFLLCLVLCWAQSCRGLGTFSFDVHHRFSEPLKKWAAGKANFVHWAWPQKGSVDYYAALAHRDRVFRGRGLAGSGAGDDLQPLTFSDGNETIKVASLGFLHYAIVALGTPNVTFLVALDTGSDLFWVPCDCISCAPTSSNRYGSDLKLSIYSPNSSSTSKAVTCDNNLCESRKHCSVANSSCPYDVAYISDDTSSSGILVEDVLYLTTEDKSREPVKASVTFGCGRVQTGSFLDSAAPNGLFGLGMEKISVPSILSDLGLTANSFSMCFGRDGIGRITFGDKGSPDQDETPFHLQKLHPTYNVSITGIRVGKTLIDSAFGAIFDSGTSFTYLTDPAYTLVSESFHAQALDKQYAPDSRIPFKYCYSISPNQNSSLIPSVSLTMQGGSQFSVYEPIILISVQGELVYCLAIVKSHDLDIIGQNFMTGNRIVFDREKNVLGWNKSDCYDIEDSNTFPVNTQKNSTSEPPSIAADPNTYTPQATKETGINDTQVSMVPSSAGHSNYLTFFPGHGAAQFLLFGLILLIL